MQGGARIVLTQFAFVPNPHPALCATTELLAMDGSFTRGEKGTAR